MNSLSEAGRWKLRLLVSANDPGAAFHFCEVLKYAYGTGQLDVCVLAGAPAQAIFERAGFKAHPSTSMRVGQLESRGLTDIIEEAGGFISRFAPDAILVGLSGPDRGVDEALLMQAGKIPTYAIQDFWGDVNPGFGVLPDTYFVLDELAAKLTRHRAPSSRVVVTGSARHAAMNLLDLASLREKFRAKAGAAPTDRIAVFFGQPLWGFPGYEATLSKTAGALPRASLGIKMYYRAHPKESLEEHIRALGCLRAQGLSAEIDDAPLVESSLCGADLMLTSFSTCGLDLAYLNRVSTVPLGAILFTMFEEDIKRFYRDTTRLEYIPLAAQGLAEMIGHEDEMENAIRIALTEEERQKKWYMTREKLTNLSGAAERIVNAIIKDLAKVVH